MLAITTYSAVMALHIMAVLAAYGLPLSAPVLLPYLRRRHPESLAGFHDGQHRLNVYLTGPGTALVLLFGIYMASEHHLWKQGWVHAGIGAIVLIGALGGWVVKATARLAELAEVDVAGPEYDALYRRYLRVETLLGLIVLAAVFVMATKALA